MDEPYITIDEAAELMHASVSTLAGLRYRGKGPAWYRPTPRSVLYKRSEVLAWIEASAQTITNR